MSTFLNMVGASRPSGQVENFVVEVAEAIRNEAMRGGYLVSYSIQHTRDPISQSVIVMILFKMIEANNTQTIEANVQIRTNEDLRSFLPTEARVHSASGFPGDLLPLLHHIPALASCWKDAGGTQAVGQGDPAQDDGREAVAQKAAQTSDSRGAVTSLITTLIDIATVKNFVTKGERTRRYLGASGIGTECAAYHALTLRGFPSDTPSPQLLRIFEAGHEIEKLVVKALKDSGHLVEELDPLTGEQWEYTTHGGHHVCHLDGMITLINSTERMSLEIKSMNKDMFTKFSSKGVKLSHPHYYDQVIDGLEIMRLNAVSVSRCLFVAYCKDNSKYHAEIVNYDVATAKALMGKVEYIVGVGGANRISSSKYEYGCKGCFKTSACWSGANPPDAEKGCWNCGFSIPASNGGKSWYCTRMALPATKLCSDYLRFEVDAK